MSKHSGKDDGWAAQATFKELTYWNHDTAPVKTDPLQRCMDWLKLAVKVRRV